MNHPEWLAGETAFRRWAEGLVVTTGRAVDGDGKVRTFFDTTDPGSGTSLRGMTSEGATAGELKTRMTRELYAAVNTAADPTYAPAS